MKRGQSGYSLVVAVDKPVGMTSHDVVSRCRTIFGEKRVGHTGTLDPFASGVLPICVGPATRLSSYLTNHDKSYRVRIGFGYETNTDDCEGEPTVTATVPGRLYDEEFARAFVESLVGEHDQVPPAYSAIKVNGERAYVRARKGEAVELAPRRIRVYEAALTGMGEDDLARAWWDVELSVSKGTYIRSLARDAGRALGCPAHVEALERTRAGRIKLADCVSLDSLASLGAEAAIDPVRILGCRFMFVDDAEDKVGNGTPLPANGRVLYEPLPMLGEERICACSTSLEQACEGPRDGELIALIARNRLKALDTFDAHDLLLRPSCVFAEGVSRG